MESIVEVGVKREDFFCGVATLTHAIVGSDRVNRAPKWHVGLHREKECPCIYFKDDEIFATAAATMMALSCVRNLFTLRHRISNQTDGMKNINN